MAIAALQRQVGRRCLVTGEVPKTIHILLLIFGLNLSVKKNSDFVAGAASCNLFYLFLNRS